MRPITTQNFCSLRFQYRPHFGLHRHLCKQRNSKLLTTCLCVRRFVNASLACFSFLRKLLFVHSLQRLQKSRGRWRIWAIWISFELCPQNDVSNQCVQNGPLSRLLYRKNRHLGRTSDISLSLSFLLKPTFKKFDCLLFGI